MNETPGDSASACTSESLRNREYALSKDSIYAAIADFFAIC